MSLKRAIWIAAAFGFFSALSQAGDEVLIQKPNQPYIDQLKQSMSEEGTAPTENPNGTPFIDSIKKKINEEGTAEGTHDSLGYSEELKRSFNGKSVKPQEGSFTEQERIKLGTGSPQGGAIAAVHEGHSALEQKIEGKINGAFGFRMAASADRQITGTGDAVANGFTSLYGTKWVPDLNFFYEYQPFHSEWFGNIGLVFNSGFSVHEGKGFFQFPLTNPKTGQLFNQQSQTEFHFITLPVMLGLKYQFNLFRVLRPYVQAGPTLIGYMEIRNDSKGGNRGNSRGLLFNAGVNVLLDWFSRQFAWDIYQDLGVKHSYLTLDYSRLSTLNGDVSFTNSALSAGLSYEF